MFILQSHIIALLAAIFLIGKCYAHPMIWQRQDIRSKECTGCGNECDKCKYGVTVSALCGIEECRRGPGEYCGGPSQSWGVCGEGMFCICDRCVGCSVDFLTCFTKSCLPHQSLEQRGHHEINDGVFINRYMENRPPDGRLIEGRQMDERRLRGLNMKRK
ncbi:neuroparsin-A [Harpegnathos saltator]|uniref:neuroparsin-A n=1 Tax=Harpegnathos saltator TaxID=610380 RepID=UPI00058BDE50|nr:neuroparsin-A [Harpegnathos saltator]XP_011141109.1 neuroparsin-A [Harpegnathos saltator]XP_025154127.1 neuroparsin-A [Harpegnathos saltator]